MSCPVPFGGRSVSRRGGKSPPIPNSVRRNEEAAHAFSADWGLRPRCRCVPEPIRRARAVRSNGRRGFAVERGCGRAARGGARDRRCDRSGGCRLRRTRAARHRAIRHPPRYPAHEYAGRARHVHAHHHSRHPVLAGAGCRLRGAERRAGGERGHLHHLRERDRRHGSGHQPRRRHPDPVGRDAAPSGRSSGPAGRAKRQGEGERGQLRRRARGYRDPQGGQRRRGLHPRPGRAQ
jgi:hypothetical protein